MHAIGWIPVSRDDRQYGERAGVAYGGGIDATIPREHKRGVEYRHGRELPGNASREHGIGTHDASHRHLLAGHTAGERIVLSIGAARIGVGRVVCQRLESTRNPACLWDIFPNHSTRVRHFLANDAARQPGDYAVNACNRNLLASDTTRKRDVLAGHSTRLDRHDAQHTSDGNILSGDPASKYRRNANDGCHRLVLSERAASLREPILLGVGLVKHRSDLRNPKRFDIQHTDGKRRAIGNLYRAAWQHGEYDTVALHRTGVDARRELDLGSRRCDINGSGCGERAIPLRERDRDRDVRHGRADGRSDSSRLHHIQFSKCARLHVPERPGRRNPDRQHLPFAAANQIGGIKHRNDHHVPSYCQRDLAHQYALLGGNLG